MQDYERRVWIATAPPGVWSSGPAVIYDLQWVGHEQHPADQYREMGWTVTGPYVLEDAGK